MTRDRNLETARIQKEISDHIGAGPDFSAPGSPGGLVKQYGVWSDWVLWQYAGVDWERRASLCAALRTALPENLVGLGVVSRSEQD